jgi:uroporphyrinogen III methyltransferase/synthase
MTDEAHQPTPQPAGDLGTASSQARVQFVGTGPGDPFFINTTRQHDSDVGAKSKKITAQQHAVLSARNDDDLSAIDGVNSSKGDEEAAVLPSQPGTGAPTPVDVDEHCADVTATVMS